ncbi:Uncharacterised protein [Mycobacteroides abscessus subsp. abscessus]|nr:Uncharacterised protein [Mycobacteroides abscessus subsp. abscessus]
MRVSALTRSCKRWSLRSSWHMRMLDKTSCVSCTARVSFVYEKRSYNRRFLAGW